jgi:hypothetical protein
MSVSVAVSSTVVLVAARFSDELLLPGEVRDPSTFMLVFLLAQQVWGESVGSFVFYETRLEQSYFTMN